MTLIDRLEPRRLFAGGVVASFGGGSGFVDVPFVATAQALDNYGRAILVGGDPAHHRVRVARLKSDGTIDRSFGVDGVATIKVPELRTGRTSLEDVAVDHRRRTLIAVAGRLIRLTAAGRADRTFGDRGRIAVPQLIATDDVTVDDTNRPILGGSVTGRTGDRAAVLRLDSRGRLDTTFARGGFYKSPASNDDDNREPYRESLDVHVVALSDGRLLASAQFYQGYAAGLRVVRFDADGAIDPTYGAGNFYQSEPGVIYAFGVTDSSIESNDRELGTNLPNGQLLVEYSHFSESNPSSEDYTWQVIDRDGGGPVQVRRFGGNGYNAALSVLGAQRDGAIFTAPLGRLERYRADYELDSTFTSPSTLRVDAVLPRAADVLTITLGSSSTRVTALDI